MLRFIIFTICLIYVCGCYYIAQVDNLLSDQIRAKPIDRLAANPALSGKERRFFNEIRRIRAYAIDSIGLNTNRNYTRYVTVDSEYLVAVVSAADSASFSVKKWCYPILGCFPLRAYYDIHDAEKAAAGFRRKGYETNIDKVDGFSTLGIFSDPLYSFMADYSVFGLAQFLFHEQTHATVFLNNVQFSEELATFVAREGALAYLESYYGATSPEYTNAQRFLADQKAYLRLLRRLYADLQAVYASPMSRQDKITRKTAVVDSFKCMLYERYDSLFTTHWYRGVEKNSFNNAFLAVRMTYNLDLELFGQLHKQKNGSLREVVAYAKQLGKRRGDPKKLLKEECSNHRKFNTD